MACIGKAKHRNPKTGEVMPVACGKCLPCRIERSIDWRVRIAMEKFTQRAYGSCFCGLSYADDYFADKDVMSVSKADVVKCNKLVRYYLTDKPYVSPRLRHFAVTEYGDLSARPHAHIIYMGLNANTARAVLRKSWPHGFVTAEPLTPYRIQYVVDYCTIYDPTEEMKAEYLLNGAEPPQDLFSNGIGEDYMRAYYHEFERDGYYFVNGKKWCPPPYWLDKLGLRSCVDRVSMIRQRAAQLESFGVDVSDYVAVDRYNEQYAQGLLARQRLHGRTPVEVHIPVESFRKDSVADLAAQVAFGSPAV